VRTKRTKGDKITVRSLTGVSFEGTVNLGHRFRDNLLDVGAFPFEMKLVTEAMP
jgi:hypothetical protein